MVSLGMAPLANASSPGTRLPSTSRRDPVSYIPLLECRDAKSSSPGQGALRKEDSENCLWPAAFCSSRRCWVCSLFLIVATPSSPLNRNVYGWGFNGYCRYGLGAQADQLKPKLIPQVRLDILLVLSLSDSNDSLMPRTLQWTLKPVLHAALLSTSKGCTGWLAK
jgi:hypothetical protein